MTQNRTLYVAWQDPAATSWYPVGLLECTASSYSFQYLEGARRARAAANFPGIAQFPDLELRYTSQELFPFFKNRVVSRSRNDFGEYARRLNLNEGEVVHTMQVFEELARSNGRRATDRFEIFAPPMVENGLATFTFFLRGVRYLPELVQREWEVRDPQKPLRGLPDPMNAHDPDAVLIVSDDRFPLGYVPRYYAGAIRDLLLKHSPARFDLVLRNPPPAPTRERLLIGAQFHVPQGWNFPTSEEFDVIQAREEVAA